MDLKNQTQKREIKFRAWNKEKQIMCYDDEDNSSGYYYGICLSKISMINASLMNITGEYVFMQFVGLQDKFETDIYEGDLFQDHDLYMKVFWCNEECGYAVENSDGDIELLSSWGVQNMEVIGNIYENPDLL